MCSHIVCCGGVADDNSTTIQRLKHSVANTSSDAEAIEILQRLYDLAMSEQCYDDAMSAACKAATLCYRTENVEQVERWLVRRDSIPCNSIAARIDYYDIKLFSVLLCVNLGNFEHALVHAGEIDKNAASRRDKYGASIASYAKAKIYKDSGNLPMAYEEYKRSFSRQSGEYFSAAHTFDILSNVLGLIMQLERYNDAPVYLAQLKNIIGRTDFVKESDEYTDNQLKVVYQSFLLQYLSRMERKNEAQGAYSELVRLPKSSDYYENTRSARAY